MKITKEQLIRALEDMNKAMELEPPVNTSTPLNKLMEQFDEAREQVEPDDEFTAETWDIINAAEKKELEVVGKKSRTQEKAKKKKQTSKQHTTEPKRKAVSLHLDEELWWAFKARAMKERMPAVRLVEKVLREYLEREEKQ